MEREVWLAYPRGFCAGVDRAIDVVEKALLLYGVPLYVHHEIVHNRHVVENLRQKGVVFVDDLDEVPEGETVIFSAHGVAPVVWEKARERNLRVIDATCPLVTKVHMEAKRYAKAGYHIILIGHKNHVEARGTQGEAPSQITIVENSEEVEKLPFTEKDKLAYLTQTTLSVEETSELIEKLRQKFPQIEGPNSSDICYATTNRQQAVAHIAPHVQLMLVIGSQNSSNSNRLKEVAERWKVKSYLIDGEEDLKAQWFTPEVYRVGLTAGASAPEILVNRVLERLNKDFGFCRVREIRLKEENVVFQLPRNLREELEKLA
ncbi:MAG: 4-hydroxy-3-methylbut-2-enyl diphosphate reductase [Leptospiraceae bacterium]|nr:4-hydroxy-3-methylbut-2-enyl diphosphate reductase [Leptospiraceae bacterium]MDW8307656.1 4-hydroxy-3-methylbut-2-enyl diphosphate reductase [Leptospiraceae bacterium]